jgi:hypothetical protein
MSADASAPICFEGKFLDLTAIEQILRGYAVGGSFLAGYLAVLSCGARGLEAGMLSGARLVAASLAMEGSEPALPPL